MGKILCATRGGEGSHQTQMGAIALARERGDELTFLFIVDLSFLDRTAAPLVVDVEAHLAKMGRFQLAMAQERAAEQGIEAQAMVRHGHLRQELVAAARELGADTIILGQPQDQAESGAVFDDVALRAFAAGIASVTGAEVLIL